MKTPNNHKHGRTTAWCWTSARYAYSGPCCGCYMTKVMSIYEEELVGREFDWFASDSEGNIGLFSTAGKGKVPESVVVSYTEHDNISELLYTPSWGSTEVWSDYAALGFYVYDWSFNDGLYKREREPLSSMSAELKAQLMAMKSLHQLPVKFTELKEIAHVQRSI